MSSFLVEYKKNNILAEIQNALAIQASTYEFYYEQALEQMMRIVDLFIITEPKLATEMNIIKIAKKYGYEEPESRSQEYSDTYPNNDECMHMLPYDCCPAGCGE